MSCTLFSYSSFLCVCAFIYRYKCNVADYRIQTHEFFWQKNEILNKISLHIVLNQHYYNTHTKSTVTWKKTKTKYGLYTCQHRLFNCILSQCKWLFGNSTHQHTWKCVWTNLGHRPKKTLTLFFCCSSNFFMVKIQKKLHEKSNCQSLKRKMIEKWNEIHTTHIH